MAGCRTLRSSAGATVLFAATLLTIAAAAQAAVGDDASPAGKLFTARCGICHDKAQDRVPTRDALAQRSPDDVVAALSIGVMKSQAGGLTNGEINGLAKFLTGRDPSPGRNLAPETNICADPPLPVAVGTAQWNGWGRDSDNSRYQPEPALRATDVPKLAVKWAYGFHSGMVYGQPAVVDGRLFVTSSSGRVYSLDAMSGCTYWTFDAAAGTRTAMSVGELAPSKQVRERRRSRRKNAHIEVLKAPSAVFFGDDSGAVYALDAMRGTLLWKTQADSHPLARITGAPTLYKNRLYVPVSSSEEGVALNPAYGCCTFRGSVVALDMATGSVVWKSYTIAEEPKPYRKTAAGVQLFGPAGVAVWSAPTIDAKRGALYVGTGNSYTDIDAPLADSIVAFNLEDGKLLWVSQATPRDNWIVGCTSAAVPSCPPALQCQGGGERNCPLTVGPDWDFGSSPILRNLGNGKQIIVAGQKSGVEYGLDPDHGGNVLWQTAVGDGGAVGGIKWGPAADHRNVYVAVAEFFAHPGTPSGGLTAVDLATGVKRWHSTAILPVCAWGERNCSAAQGQAVTVMPGIVFSGAMDGHLRAYSTIGGKIIWDFDTAKEFAAVNGIKASGGSLDHGGPVIVNGMLYVNSGYGRFYGQPGNVLLAFSVGGK